MTLHQIPLALLVGAISVLLQLTGCGRTDAKRYQG